MPVLADGGMLRQMLWNLVRNAVQASSAGSFVRLWAKRVDGAIELSVADTGEGIDEESKPQLFDAFFTTRSKGTGIGLAVVKRIVDQHGWQIRVEDTPGGGATFVVSIPESTDDEAVTCPSDPRPGWTLFPRPR
jgi:signal transduction histidine kinase